MQAQEQELVFVVHLGPGGWLIEDGTTLGLSYQRTALSTLPTVWRKRSAPLASPRASK